MAETHEDTPLLAIFPRHILRPRFVQHRLIRCFRCEEMHPDHKIFKLTITDVLGSISLPLCLSCLFTEIEDIRTELPDLFLGH